MAIIDFKEISVANSGSGKQDTFELFARDFFSNLGYKISESPSRGADEGKDLVVVEPLTGIVSVIEKRWLVSCKHFAHSGRSVAAKHEIDILGRLKVQKCDGFIAFYSTLPSSGLAKTFNKIEDEFSLQIFDSARIEHLLVKDQRLRLVLRRYFPKSHQEFTQNYTWEKLYTALLILATNDGTVQERLIDAYLSSLMRLKPQDLPRGLQKEFANLEKRLTRSDATFAGEGRVHATIIKMTTIEANKIVEQIISIYDRYRVNLIDDLR